MFFSRVVKWIIHSKEYHAILKIRLISPLARQRYVIVYITARAFSLGLTPTWQVISSVVRVQANFTSVITKVICMYKAIAERKQQSHFCWEGGRPPPRPLLNPRQMFTPQFKKPLHLLFLLPFPTFTFFSLHIFLYHLGKILIDLMLKRKQVKGAHLGSFCRRFRPNSSSLANTLSFARRSTDGHRVFPNGGTFTLCRHFCCNNQTPPE